MGVKQSFSTGIRKSKKGFCKAALLLITEGCGDVGSWKEMLGEVALRTRGSSYEDPQVRGSMALPRIKLSTGKLQLDGTGEAEKSQIKGLEHYQS